MELNPLDWTAGPFLTLYVLAVTAALLLSRDLSVRLGPETVPDGPEPDPVQLGYLAGGRERAADTALVGLLQAGAATVENGTVRFDPSVPVPAAFMPFRHAGGTRAKFHSVCWDRTERIRNELVRRGLAPSAEQVGRYRIGAWGVAAVPLALGVAKVVVGASRGRPVGILVFALIVTAFLSLVLVLRTPTRTRAGSALLARLQLDRARATRAPLPEEAALAFALTGTVALMAVAEHRAFLTQSGGSDGGGTGDSGGGGDGGGGGGCGGCSA